MENFFIYHGFCTLSPLQKLILIYLIHGQRSNACGCIDMPANLLAKDLYVPEPDVTVALNELEALGHISKCSISNYILVIQFFTFRPLLDYKEAVTAQAQLSLLPISKNMYWQLYHLLGQQIALTKEFAVKNRRQLNKVTMDTALAPGRNGRGMRIDDDWRPTQEDIDFAAKNGFGEKAIQDMAGRFRDYWLAKAGPSSRKSDWRATWRTWVRNDQSGQGIRNAKSTTPSAQSMMANIRERK